MSDFPVTIDGKLYEDVQELAAEMESWGAARRTRHRGDRHSADRFNEAATDPERCGAVAAAAAVLLKTTEDPGVAELVAHLMLPPRFPDLYTVMLDRLEGKGAPLPDGDGLRTGTLRGDFVWLAYQWLPESIGSHVLERAEQIIRSEAPEHDQLVFCCKAQKDPDELLSMLKRTAEAKGINVWVLILAANHLLRQHPDRHQDTARALAVAGHELKEKVAAELRKNLPEWFKENGGVFRQGLGLH